MPTTTSKARRPRRWPYALIVVCGLLIAAWLWRRDDAEAVPRDAPVVERGAAVRVAAGGRTHARVPPTARFALRGHVVFPDGRPVPGAEVVIQSGPAPVGGADVAAAERDGARKTIAGPDGAFELANLRVGTYLLAAVHEDDVAPTTQAEVAASAAPVTLVVVPGAALEVVVRSAADRAPLAGATVRITDADRSFGEQWSFRAAQTDARGVAKFRGVIATASHLIAASAPGHAETTLAIHDFQFAGRAWSVEVVLPRAGQIAGRVVDASGRGVANATVGWERGGVPRPADTPDLFDPHAFHGQLQAVQTDAEGRFALAAEPGAGCVLATHPAHQLGQACGLTISVGEQRAGVEVVLRDGGRVSGQVVWADGTPAAGATVIATKRGWIHQPMQSRSYRFEMRTGLDGRFEFRGIKRGELDLAAHTDAASSPLVPVDLGKQSEQRDLTITLAYEGTIRGRVVDDGKQPVGHALVEYFIDPMMGPPDAQGKPRPRLRALAAAEHPDFALPRSIGATRADRDGNFEIRGLPDGLYAVKASRPQAIDLPTAFTSTTEQGVGIGDTVELVLTGLGGVRGRVLADTGRPVSAFGVSLAPASAKVTREQFLVAHRVVANDGTFVLGSVPAGQYRVRIDGEDVTEQVVADTVTVTPGKVADVGTIQVARGVRRRGVVLDKARKPAPGARITAARGGAVEPVLVEADDEGRFVLPPLPPDEALRVRGDTYEAASEWIAVPPSTATIEIVLANEARGVVSGVLLESGVRLERRTIVLTLVGDGTPDDKLSPVRNTLTTEGGRFQFDAVPRGNYLVWVRRHSRTKETIAEPWWKHEAPIQVEPHHETQVVLPVPALPAGPTSDAPAGGSGAGQGGTR